MLVICERWSKYDSSARQWGPPGGGSKHYDRNEWESAAREFREEVKVDWSAATDALDCFTWHRFEGDPKTSGGGARWALLANEDVWTLSSRMNLEMAGEWNDDTRETCGVDWVGCTQLAAADFDPLTDDVTLLASGRRVRLRREYATDTQLMVRQVLGALRVRPLFCGKPKGP